LHSNIWTNEQPSIDSELTLSLEFCRHHHNGRWEARIGRVLGNKYLYLGTYGNCTRFLLVLMIKHEHFDFLPDENKIYR
jgi:hypothetical protein